MENNTQKVINLIQELCKAGLKQDFIASKVREYCISPSLKGTDKSKINKIKEGVLTLERSRSLIPEWVSILERIKIENLPNSNIEVILGNYIGYYYDDDAEKLRLILLTIREDGIKISSERRNYVGKYNIVSDALIANVSLISGANPMILYSNLDGALLLKVHTQVMVFHCTFKEGKGVMTDKVVFFYVDSESKEIENTERDVFLTHKELYSDLYKKALDFFEKYSMVKTSKCRFEYEDEFVKWFLLHKE